MQEKESNFMLSLLYGIIIGLTIYMVVLGIRIYKNDKWILKQSNDILDLVNGTITQNGKLNDSILELHKRIKNLEEGKRTITINNN